MTYERLREQFDECVADKEYIEILNLAAGNGEDKVSDILSDLLSEEKFFTMDMVKRKLDLPVSIP